MKKYLLVGGPLDGQYHEGEPFREYEEIIETHTSMVDYLYPKKNVSYGAEDFKKVRTF